LELSFWHKILDDQSDVPSFEVNEYNIRGDIVKTQSFRDWDISRPEIYNEWSRYFRLLELDTKTTAIDLVIYGRHQFIDKLLLKSPNLNVHQMIGENEAFANHLMVTIK
jgi:hypothetical protein